MAERAINNIDFLRFVASCNQMQRGKIIMNATKDQFQALCDCLHNTLNGTILLTDEEEKKFKRQNSIVKEVLYGNLDWKKRRDILSKNGGALPHVLPAAVCLLQDIQAQGWENEDQGSQRRHRREAY